MSIAANTSYKKKDGTLTLSSDGKSLLWAAISTSSETTPVQISVETISNLQATPPSSSKVMMKVFATQSPGSVAEQYVFTFVSPDARHQADMMKEALTNAIQAIKLSYSRNDGATGVGTAKVNSNMGEQLGNWRNEDFLHDMALQQAVLASSEELQKTFHEAVIEGNVTAGQFWSTRIQLLRAHAVEHAQSRGSYNVLATIKPKTEDAVLRVSLSRDQIHDIFEQHPLVKRVYDEVVPKLREDEFWRRFFLSRLYKKLKGEKLIPTDGYDDILDPYLKLNELNHRETRDKTTPVPHIIDLEGNEANHSQKQGNRPDLTMRPNVGENVPIIRTLNELSSKIIDHAQPAEIPPENAHLVEDRFISDIRLTDLQGDPAQEHILLRIRDQKHFFDVEVQPDPQTESTLTYYTSHASVLRDLQDEITIICSDNLDWNTEQEITNNNGHDLEQDAQTSSVFRLASSDLSEILKTCRAQLSNLSGRGGDDMRLMESADDPGRSVLNRLILTHATSTEFLRHYWGAFLSGDPKRSSDIRNMIESLRRSLQRITTIAEEAAREETELESRAAHEAEVGGEPEKKKKKKKRPQAHVYRGAELVEQIISSQRKAINMALTRYQQAIDGEQDS